MKNIFFTFLILSSFHCLTQSNITFRVNMSSYVLSNYIAPQGMRIAGNFNGWDPNIGGPMTNIGNNIWEKTIQINNASLPILYYKFINGDWGNAEVFNNIGVTGNCTEETSPGYINRMLNAPLNDTTVVYLWNKCTSCFIEGGTDTITNCNNYTWIDGNTYNSSGNYHVLYSNQNNCDSVRRLALTILNPTTPEICLVNSDNQSANNKIIWEKENALAVDSFYVWKESNIQNVYNRIGGTSSLDSAYFIDVNSNANVNSEKYQLELKDTCGYFSGLSSPHKTIHLTSNMGLNGSINLIWNHYEGLTYSSYYILRGSSINDINIIDTIQNGLNSYTDVNPFEGNSFYQVGFIKETPCNPEKIGNYDASFSNVAGIYLANLNSVENSEIKIYPNPVKDILKIQVSENFLKEEIIIFDQLFRETKKITLLNLVNEIDFSMCNNGIYYIYFPSSSNFYKIGK